MYAGVRIIYIYIYNSIEDEVIISRCWIKLKNMKDAYRFFFLNIILTLNSTVKIFISPSIPLQSLKEKKRRKLYFSIRRNSKVPEKKVTHLRQNSEFSLLVIATFDRILFDEIASRLKKRKKMVQNERRRKKERERNRRFPEQVQYIASNELNIIDDSRNCFLLLTDHVATCRVK